jgi:hypothetical protein
MPPSPHPAAQQPPGRATGTPGDTSPIFVVGVPRSGTTLLAAMLGAHSRIDSGPETFLLTQLSATARDVLAASSWPDAATEFLCSIRLGEHRVHELYGRTRDQIRVALAGRSPAPAAMLEALTADRATANGKFRVVEKTPRHLANVRAIRAGWPRAPVVRVVRDPRDVALSLSRVPFGSPSVVVNLCQVVTLDRAANDFFLADQRSFTVRYEDLVRQPEDTLRVLCAFIGESFEPRMIERPDAEIMAADHEWWKRGASEPLDPSRIARWRTELEPQLHRFASLHCHDLLVDHGYEGARQPRVRVAVVPLAERLANNDESVLLGLAGRDAVVQQPTPRTARGLRRQQAIVFWGVPGQLGIRLGTKRVPRIRELARISLDLLGRRIRRRPALWVRRPTTWRLRPDDRSEAVLGRALTVLARQVPPEAVPDLAAPTSKG